MSYTNSLNINTQQNGIINLVKQVVGTRLAQIKSSSNVGQLVPAVIKKRSTDRASTNQPAVDLPYPYCLVDFLNASFWGGAELVNEKYADNGNRLYETDYIVKFVIDFVGRQTDDVHSIALSLHKALTTSFFRNKESDLTGGRLFKISNDVNRGMIQRQTEWVDLSTIVIDITFRDVLEIDSEGNIVQIILNGELHDHFIDPDPILININTNEV